MPNHFTTVGLCSRRYDTEGNEIEYQTIKEGLEGKDLCELVCPMPEDLMGIVSGWPTSGRYRHKGDSRWWMEDCNGPQKSREEWEFVELTPLEQSTLLRKYGATNWYDWCDNNWGTKWGTYSLKVHELGGDGSPILIEFQSAWGPPSPNIMRLINKYLFENFYLENIKWIGHDPANNFNVDIPVNN